MKALVLLWPAECPRYIFCCACTSVSACACTACTTFGWQCPVDATPMPVTFRFVKLSIRQTRPRQGRKKLHRHMHRHENSNHTHHCSYQGMLFRLSWILCTLYRPWPPHPAIGFEMNRRRLITLHVTSTFAELERWNACNAYVGVCHCRRSVQANLGLLLLCTRAKLQQPQGMQCIS
jgi:hypothetical protein